MNGDINGPHGDINLQEISSAQPGAQTAMPARERKPNNDPASLSLSSTAIQPGERKPNTGPPPPQAPEAADRCCRWTAVGLGMLCAVLFVLFIRLVTSVLTERDQLLTYEREQLLSNHSKLCNEREQMLANHSQLLNEREQLLANHSKLLKERDQLLIDNNNLLMYKQQLLKLCEERSCPRSWVRFECSCYLNDAQAARPWSDSRRYCQSLGGDLALIKTPEQQRFITNKKFDGWIGLKRGQDGSWTWTDDTPLSTGYWHPGQPNTDTENCVIIQNMDWHDYNCTTIHWSICERPFL